MNEFNIMVLNVAVIVFIIALIVVGYILYFTSKNSTFPPYDTQCPTYYRLDGTGKNCVFDGETYQNPSYPALAHSGSNTDMGKYQGLECSTVPVATFNQSGFSRDEVLCAKNRWAHKCGVYWDGVTNNNNACFRQNSSFFN